MTEPGLSLYIDLQIAQTPVYTERGSVRYAVEHARALIKREGLVSGLSLNALLPFPKDLPAELRAFPLLHWASIKKFAEAGAGGPVAFFIASPFAGGAPESILPPYVLRPDVPLIATLVDLTPLTSKDPVFARREVAGRYATRFRMVEQSDLILTISENTRTQAIELLDVPPRRVVNIGTGVSEFFRPDIAERSLEIVQSAIPGLRKPFIFSVTGTWEWKNTHTLIEAFSRLPAAVRGELQLVVTCRLNEEYRMKWSALASRCGLKEEDLILTDVVPDNILRSLYRSARLFVYPSLYEGFGLPAAEAAACGCPTIVSCTSSLPEILQYPPATFEPESAESMSILIEKALTDSEFNLRLLEAAGAAARRNTWTAVVDKTVQALSLVNHGNTGSPVPVQPRLLYASDFGEGATAGRKVDFASALSVRCNLDVAAAGPVHFPTLRSKTKTRCFPIEALGKWLDPTGYDAIIYELDGESGGPIGSKASVFPGILMIGAGKETSLHPSFGLKESKWSAMIRSAKAVVTATPGQARFAEFEIGPGAIGPPATVIDAFAPGRRRADHLMAFLQKESLLSSS